MKTVEQVVVNTDLTEFVCVKSFSEIRKDFPNYVSTHKLDSLLVEIYHKMYVFYRIYNGHSSFSFNYVYMPPILNDFKRAENEIKNCDVKIIRIIIKGENYYFSKDEHFLFNLKLFS
jgi:hypothetical protein